jgi:hypothetical protein
VAKTLSEIVLEEGLADAAALTEAARRADRAEEPLVVALVREAAISEVALVAAIRRQVRVTIADPGVLKPEHDALREVPQELCRRRRVVPLTVHDHDAGPRTLRLAMADPTDQFVIAEVEHITGCRVEPVLMTLSAIDELVDTGYRGVVTEVMKRRGRGPGPAQPATWPAAPAEEQRSGPASTTAPFHRVADEADAAVRLEALISLLIGKGVIDDSEYAEAVRAAMKRRSADT